MPWLSGKGATSDYNVGSYSNCLLGIFSLDSFLDPGNTEKTYKEHEVIVSKNLTLGALPWDTHSAAEEEEGRSWVSSQKLTFKLWDFLLHKP